MPDGIHFSRQKETLFRLRIGDLAAWHPMVARDHCRAKRAVMIRARVARFGAERRLVFLVTRLRCKEAQGRRPASRIRLRSKFPVQSGPETVEVWLKGEAPF